jgi:hypothetical protein
VSTYDAIDLEFSWDGDFAIGNDGDFKDTSYDTIQALVQEVQSLVKSKFGDWKEHPTLAGDLNKFRGEPNTRETGKAIEEGLRSVLITHNIVRPEDLSIRVVPVHIHQVAILIRISALATPQNSLVLGEPVSITLIYDSVEDGIFYIPENRTEENYAFRRNR